MSAKKIFSNENTILKDLQSNEIDVQNFKLDLNQNLFIANNVVMTDKELNIFNIIESINLFIRTSYFIYVVYYLS